MRKYLLVDTLIQDRRWRVRVILHRSILALVLNIYHHHNIVTNYDFCLLYTSDAADE